MKETGQHEHEVMDLREAAKLLRISPDALYKYAKEGYLPAFKLGNRWRFSRAALLRWIDQSSAGGGERCR